MKRTLKSLLSNQEIFALINVANIRSSLLSTNAVTSPKEFFKFTDKANGIPILIPANKKLFYFGQNDFFHLSKKQILKSIYGLSDEKYVGFTHAFKQLSFLNNFEIKDIYKPYVDSFVKQNLNTIAQISSLKDKFKRVGAFQTRNIPHFGHEKIIQRMLDSCDHVVINPVIGPKKKGDVKLESLSDVFSFLTKSKYGAKISFQPIFANMFYAGPREAMHHALMRQRIGFQHFTVGRDHAGADHAYGPRMAPQYISQNRQQLKIDVMLHEGAACCHKCNDVILVGDCDQSSEDINDISGSDFRSSILARRIFKFADEKMQAYLLKNNMEIFEV